MFIFWGCFSKKLRHANLFLSSVKCVICLILHFLELRYSYICIGLDMPTFFYLFLLLRWLNHNALPHFCILDTKRLKLSLRIDVFDLKLCINVWRVPTSLAHSCISLIGPFFCSITIIISKVFDEHILHAESIRSIYHLIFDGSGI